MSSKKELFCNLEVAHYEAEHIRRIANALVKTASLQETCDLIISKCKDALRADAICLFLLEKRESNKEEYKMVAEIGCTEEFKKEWKWVPKDRLPLANIKNSYEAVFIGTPSEVKKEITNIENLVDQSRRQVIAYAPMVVNGKPVGVIGFSYNSSESAHADKPFIITLVSLCAQGLERARLFEQERKARQEAEAANKAKTDFLASMSHEIRTPIGIIKGFSELIYNSSALPASEKRWALRILKNSEHLAALIGDILDISKIEAKKVEVNKMSFLLSELIDDIKAVIPMKAEEKSIDLKFLCANANISIFSDPIHLRQIVINLIGNAIKFTPRRGLIEVLFEVKNSRLRVQVKDSGPGVPPEYQSDIFEPFTQVGAILQGSTAGTGLGLSISKRLAKELGGDLFLISSDSTTGSTFLVDIFCETYALSEVKLNQLKNQDRKLENIKILLVEDSEDNQELIKRILWSQGGEVDIAENGIMGVQKALSDDYNLVIMDIQMPVMDGNQAVAELRTKGYTKPIIALTAEVMSGIREKTLRRGFDEYLSKPIDIRTFVQTLARLAHTDTIF